MDRSILLCNLPHSSTPRNPKDASSQIKYVTDRIIKHKSSSPTPIFEAVKQMSKGFQVIAHELTLHRAEIDALREANKALSKRRKAKKTRLSNMG